MNRCANPSVKQAQNENLTLMITNTVMKKFSFHTGSPNFNSLLLCFDLFEVKAANLCYNNKWTTNFDPQYKKPGTKRKLTIWQEFTMVVLRLRLGNLNGKI